MSEPKTDATVEAAARRRLYGHGTDAATDVFGEQAALPRCPACGWPVSMNHDCPSIRATDAS